MIAAPQNNDGRKRGWKRAEEGDVWKNIWFVSVCLRERERETGSLLEDKSKIPL